MNCSCTQTNRSSRAKPRLTRFWSGATDTGLVFWMNSAVTGGPSGERIGIAAQHRADARLIEHAHRADRARRALRSSSCSSDRCRRCCGTPRPLRVARRRSRPRCSSRRACWRRRCASARSRSRGGNRRACVSPTRRAKCFDGGDVAARDRRGPFRRARPQMRLELARRVGVSGRDRRGPPCRRETGNASPRRRARRRCPGRSSTARSACSHGVVHVDVDRDDLGAALLAGADRVGHHVDLGVDRIGAPDHHQVGLAPSRADRARRSCRCRPRSPHRPG